MNWSDKDIDGLFKEAADSKSFEYKDAYFKDIEAMLPIRRKNRFFWVFNVLGLVFIGLFAGLMIQPAEQSTSLALGSKGTTDNSIASTQLESTIWHNSSNHLPSTNVEVTAPAKRGANNKLNRSITRIENTPTQKIQTPAQQSIEPRYEGHAQGKVNGLGQTTDDLSLLALSPIEYSIASNNLKIEDQLFASSSTKRSQSKIYVDASFNFGQSLMHNDSKNSSQSLAYEFGAGYQFSQKNFTLSAGAGIRQSFYNNIAINERSTVYGFGVNTFDNEYKFKSLLQVQIPLEFGYRFKQHEFNIGASASIPVLASFEHKKVVNSTKEENSDGFTMASSLFKRITPELRIGYRYNLPSDWSVAAKINAQVINPIIAERFTGEATKMPLSLQLSVRKSFSIK